ncbi:MAG: diaminopimelate decarboxylase [Bacteroidales bacterium]
MFDRGIVAQFEQLHTPFYYYDSELLTKTLLALKETADSNGYIVHYAVKANANERILRTIADYGFGADCVSENEIRMAIDCGFKSEHIVFAGVGKSDEEIKYAITIGVFSINCESVQELEIINHFSDLLKKRTQVALRVNPDIDAHTHKNITTGTRFNKFGVTENELYSIFDQPNRYQHIYFTGIHFHIGSQITDKQVFISLCHRINYIQKKLYEKNVYLPHLNVGGGLGINYESPVNQIPDFRTYFSLFKNHLQIMNDQKVHFEPGRSVVGQSGMLITKVLYVKENHGRKTIICDAGFTELIRPALYNSSHKIINLSSGHGSQVYDIAGPICESSDYFGREITLAESKRGDLLAIFSVGAYGEVMASRYNLRPLAKKYFSEDIITYEYS